MILEAKARLTLLGHSYDGKLQEGLSGTGKYSDRWTIYICPSCRTETGFEWADFGKHVGSGFSNLTYQDRQAVEREVASRLTDENAFVDFYCQGCNGVVRIYYRYEPPERNSGVLSLKTVVERAPAGKPN
jgi:hypothetical protein